MVMRLAIVHLLLVALVEGAAGNADEDDHHAEVHQVAAIAARVAPGELEHRGEEVLAGVHFRMT